MKVYIMLVVMFFAAVGASAQNQYNMKTSDIAKKALRFDGLSMT